VSVWHTTLGGLDCRLVEPRGSVDRAVVLCHGFGAPADNLVPLGEELVRQPGIAESTLLVFPAAPLSLAGVGLSSSRAWWLFDFLRMAERGLAGALEVLRTDVPEGLGPARRKITALVDQLTRERALPLSRVVLGGFSQGAMLATDVALRLDEPPFALCVFSGTLTCEEDWKRRAPRRAGLRVLLTHGRWDPLLPYAGAVALQELLEEAGLRVDFRPFDGAHTIGPEGLAALGALIREMGPR
jgi:phospholipase/carboxylesterase